MTKQWQWEDEESGWCLSFDAQSGKLSWGGWNLRRPDEGGGQEQTAEEFLANTGNSYRDRCPASILNEVTQLLTNWKQRQPK